MQYFLDFSEQDAVLIKEEVEEITPEDEDISNEDDQEETPEVTISGSNADGGMH